METTYDSVIEQIVQSIFSTMLNKDLVRVDEPTLVDRESLLATVQISGQWMGSVVLALSSDAAHTAAATMLQISDHDVTDVDKQDVAAELVNMVGGNLKSLLPGPSFLSLPTIVSGSDFGLRMHHAQLIDDVVLSGDVGVLRIRLYEKPL
jgi:chemotaxis protein CheX